MNWRINAGEAFDGRMKRMVIVWLEYQTEHIPVGSVVDGGHCDATIILMSLDDHFVRVVIRLVSESVMEENLCCRCGHAGIMEITQLIEFLRHSVVMIPD